MEPKGSVPDSSFKKKILDFHEDGPVPSDQDNNEITRDSFPKEFIFGTGTSAFQVEGAAAKDGKGLSIWDTFTIKTPVMIDDGSNGNVASDMYHRYKEDIKTMKKMGFKAYRFSISWARILPGARLSAGINKEGIKFYNHLINTVKANGMEPYVTLFHWDLPDCLEEEYDGFLNKKVADDFVEFADLCFSKFGDRVKMWATLNEPWTVAHHGYVSGYFPPSKPTCKPKKCHNKLPPYRCCIPEDDQLIKKTCKDYKNDQKSNPDRDPYTVTRNLLLCHAVAARRYKDNYQTDQEGHIGIVLNSHWYVALNKKSEKDRDAARRAVDFMLGCYLDPILNGRFPDSVTEHVPKENLESFTTEEWKMVKGSIDYLGLNYYSTYYAKHDPEPERKTGYVADKKVKYENKREGDTDPIGVPATGSTWLNIVPWGIYRHLVFLKQTYPNLPPIYITENGVSEENNVHLTALEACHDPHRVKYHQDHLANILQAMVKHQVDVRGYFAWSWCDNFEWKEGYTSRFGLMYVDFVNNQTRYPKDSAVWFAHFLHNQTMLPCKQISYKRHREEMDKNEEKRRLEADEEINNPMLDTV